MNIQEAKTDIIHTFRAYMKQGPDGTYRIPIQKQRPLLLIGPPGIGKTAVMEQIAREEKIGLVSYTMTHHTRQSAVGLPLIQEKEYAGKTYSATEYTMSEIIASIYDCMAETGRKQGILFLDEINCVSETLSPVMLQLLQNKMFGTYAIPDGWMIAAAGNPPEYNKSVRELDMATLDRVKHMEIQADPDVWMDYAFAHQVHPCVTAYLTAHPDHFYQIQDTLRGQLFVTARGWEDLSCIIRAYEEDQIPVQESLMIQYLQHDEIARSFYLFYDLFRHFENKTKPYAKADISSGGLWNLNLAHADISQGLAVASHLMACIRHEALYWREQSILEKELKEALTSWRQKTTQRIENTENRNSAKSTETSDNFRTPLTLLSQLIESRRAALKIKESKQLIEKEDAHKEQLLIRKLEDLLQKQTKKIRTETEAVSKILAEAEAACGQARSQLLDTIARSYRLLETFPGDEPLLYFTADLTGEPDCAELLAAGPCPEYVDHSQKLLLARQEHKLLQTLAKE